MRKQFTLVLTIILAFLHLSTPTLYSRRTLVIYTYDSLLKWGKEPEKVWESVFTEFGKRYGCEVKVRTFPGAREMLLALIEELRTLKSTRADVVIGIDNIMVFEVKREELFSPYTPSNIDELDERLVASLDPEHYVIPYDFSVIAFVYDTKYVTPRNLSFTDFYDPELASTLIVEDPTLSSTGLNFLIWQILFYEKVLGRDWKEWWVNVRDHVKVVPSWGDAYDIFLNEAAGRHIVVSYGTDPAYSLYFYNSTRYAASLAHRGLRFKGYAWLQIEGIGILKGSQNKDLAEKFVEWFLSKDVQRYIPLNQWMYPANKLVKLPKVYKVAINPYKVKLLNTMVSSEYIEANLNRWIREWKEVVAG